MVINDGETLRSLRLRPVVVVCDECGEERRDRGHFARIRESLEFTSKRQVG